MRGWQDFDLLSTGQFALFLFSGTFSPVDDYPVVLQALVEATPLYHAVELVRGVVLGELAAGLLVHVAYLAVMTVAGLLFAARRLERLLCP